jgi:ubiquitin C-terminal hydrolase
MLQYGRNSGSTFQTESELACPECATSRLADGKGASAELPFPPGTGRFDAVGWGACWDGWASQGEVVEDWTSPGCGTTTDARKSTCLTSTPELLMCTLKRYTSPVSKCLGRVVVPQSFQVLGDTFSLCGIVRHKGHTLSAGHYTAQVGDWTISDSHAWRIAGDSAGEAYMALFEKGDPTAPADGTAH